MPETLFLYSPYLQKIDLIRFRIIDNPAFRKKHDFAKFLA